MQLIYVQLDREAILQQLKAANDLPKNNADGELVFDSQIPLPYILRQEKNIHGGNLSDDKLDWNNIVDGILYVALYEPQHEHRTYYKDFLLAVEPELPYILRDRLRSQYQECLWQYARDTVNILLFLFPQKNWPRLELCYLYEQEAEMAFVEQRFADGLSCWNLAALAYKHLLERDNLDTKCYFQLGYYYLQCHNYPAAYQAFVSCQQRALAPEHPLWGKAHSWRQKLYLFEPPIEEEGSEGVEYDNPGSQAGVVIARLWPPFLQELQNALQAQTHGQRRELLCSALNTLDKFLGLAPTAGCLWYLRGFCLLYGCDVAGLADIGDSSSLGSRGGASQAFAKAQAELWMSPLEWQLPYYLGVSYYLEGAYREAERSFFAVLSRDTEHCASLYWLEKIYADLEQPASQQYRALLQELNPNFPNLIEAFL